MNEHHYQRIDKGIKRTYQHKPVSPKADLGTWVIPEDLDPYEVLDRYLAESTTSNIAAQYGLSRKALVKWLRTTLPEAWHQVQIVRALCRKDDGDEGIEGAADALSLARAREMLKSGQWDLERLDSKNYGIKQEVTHELGQSFTAALLEISKTRALRDTHVMSNAEPNVINDIQDIDALPASDPAKDTQVTE